ncbi:TonB-dependent siderophore receptor [Vibrio sonorensis]|uniref:TonB-dependent siderophore receptor n=1 Tax=Vibrio sonorensis TaxID=1004316 RepID=UPI0008D95322|nr:TonB-dependent siderophore receptor [Vibrio sonorensis]
METIKKTTLSKSVVCLAVGMALSAGAFAEETTQLDEVVVWGTKVTSSSESLVSDDMSLKQADHMSDLLREIPGVDVGGTHSVNQSINIRGLRETDLDIRLDGASQHANMFHHIGNLTLNPDILKSADIQVGNNSVLQNGLGGSVLFETKDAKDLLLGDQQIGARYYGGFASNDLVQGSMTVYGLLSDRVDTLVYGQFVERDNAEDGNGVEQLGAAGKQHNILAKLGFEPSDGHRFEFTLDSYRDEGNYNPRPDINAEGNYKISKNSTLPTTYERLTLTASYELDKENHRGKTVFYSTKTNLDRDETLAGPRFGERQSRNKASNENQGINAIFYADLPLGSLQNELAYGLDYMKKESSNTLGSTGEEINEDSVATAVFVEDTLYVLPSLSFTAGLRFDDYERNAVVAKNDFDELTWSLGTEWYITDDFAVFANARTLFKGPELMESFIYYQDTAVVADDLKAETGLNRQIGFKYSSKFDDHRVSANLTLFRTDIDDYIYDAYQRETRNYYLSNIDDVEMDGFEASLGYAYQQFAAKLSYAKSDIAYESGLPVTHVSRSQDVGDSINFSADYYADSVDLLLGWNSQFVREEDNVKQGAKAKPSYHVHNLYAQWIPADVDQLTVTFGIDNIFDETYYSHASRSGVAGPTFADDYEPGRNVKLSLAYQF